MSGALRSCLPPRPDDSCPPGLLSYTGALKMPDVKMQDLKLQDKKDMIIHMDEALCIKAT